MCQRQLCSLAPVLLFIWYWLVFFSRLNCAQHSHFSYTLNMICHYLQAQTKPNVHAIPCRMPYKLEMIALSHIEPIKMPLLLFDKYTSHFTKTKPRRVLINEEYRKCFVSVLSECVCLCVFLFTSEWITKKWQKTTAKSVNDTRHTNNQNEMMPSRTLKRINTIRCQMNVICKWASHDMWLAILNTYSRTKQIVHASID